MNTAVSSCNPASFPIPEFGRSADGLIVARIGDAAYPQSETYLPSDEAVDETLAANGRIFPKEGQLFGS